MRKKASSTGNSDLLYETNIVFPLKKPETYFDSLVNINVNNLREYYSMVKSHTNKSFWIALVLTVAGFFLIIGGISLIFFDLVDQNISVLITISGVITEFISAASFYLYNSTVKQLKEYFDSLVHVQKVLLSFKVIEDAKGTTEESKNIMMNKALEYIWGDRPNLSTNQKE
ncbi:hypothetical protein [Clostridium sp. KNHs205]|uniref:TRADD-N-associated membrane domain-containing protein n=1 Tax=Clostridium sp. KNHs205 TaxID=1449050 RepID=UPI0006909E25|nr:hypothetical protein [Clostridium sp. KNHs205]